MPGAGGNQYVRLICAALGSPIPPLLDGAAPAPLALPDPLHGVPARARTEPLGRRSPLFSESLVAAGPVTTVVEKSFEGLPSRPPELPLPALLVGGFARARGTAGSARCVSLCPPPSPGISAGPSSATRPALPGGTPGCNSALAAAADETAARILSTGIGGFVAGVLTASVLRRARDGPVGVYNPRQGPWEVMAPRSSCPGEDFTPLRGDCGHPVQRKLNTLPQGHPFFFSALSARLVRRRRWPTPLPALAKQQKGSPRPCFFRS
jgi:hypothetical protein